ncbi:hypothetical protein Tco_0353246 [Tanacetum coccineum]
MVSLNIAIVTDIVYYPDDSYITDLYNPADAYIDIAKSLSDSKYEIANRYLNSYRYNKVTMTDQGYRRLNAEIIIGLNRYRIFEADIFSYDTDSAGGLIYSLARIIIGEVFINLKAIVIRLIVIGDRAILDLIVIRIVIAIVYRYNVGIAISGDRFIVIPVTKSLSSYRLSLSRSVIRDLGITIGDRDLIRDRYRDRYRRSALCIYRTIRAISLSLIETLMRISLSLLAIAIKSIAILYQCINGRISAHRDPRSSDSTIVSEASWNANAVDRD